jgi:hypothetical protein
VYQKTDQLAENQDAMLTSSNRAKNRTLLSSLRTERRPQTALKLQSKKYKTATAILAVLGLPYQTLFRVLGLQVHQISMRAAPDQHTQGHSSMAPAN